MRKQLATFELACHDAGLKATHQRLEIYRELITAKDHPTADTLYQRLRMRLPTISLDTVYRTLSTLADHGLINRVETAESLARFEASSVRHHHIICRKCGHIVDFVWSLIDEVPLPNEISEWGNIDHKSLVVYGTCNRCLK
jgi:Fur family transcriptional regulator, peroxide stress response regulator